MRRWLPAAVSLRRAAEVTQFTQHAGKQGRQVLGNAADRQDVESDRGAPRKAEACMAGRLCRFGRSVCSAAQQERVHVHVDPPRRWPDRSVKWIYFGQVEMSDY
jgi:hypothetical protein